MLVQSTTLLSPPNGVSSLDWFFSRKLRPPPIDAVWHDQPTPSTWHLPPLYSLLLPSLQPHNHTSSLLTIIPFLLSGAALSHHATLSLSLSQAARYACTCQNGHIYNFLNRFWWWGPIALYWVVVVFKVLRKKKEKKMIHLLEAVELLSCKNGKRWTHRLVIPLSSNSGPFIRSLPLYVTGIDRKI